MGYFERIKKKIGLPSKFIYKNKTITDALGLQIVFMITFLTLDHVCQKKSIAQ